MILAECRPSEPVSILLFGPCVARSPDPCCVHGTRRPDQREHRIHGLWFAFRRNRVGMQALRARLRRRAVDWRPTALPGSGSRSPCRSGVRVSRADVVQSKSTRLGSSDWPRARCGRTGEGSRNERLYNKPLQQTARPSTALRAAPVRPQLKGMVLYELRQNIGVGS